MNKKIYNIFKSIYCSNFFNFFRKIKNFFLIKIKHRKNLKNNKYFKLHLGCGGRYIEDYENIDIRKTRTTDVVCDIKKLPYPNNSSEIIEAYHVIEHLSKNDFEKSLRECHRVLKKGGKLIIECPDFDEAIKEYLNGNEKRIDNIFGMHRFFGDTHLFGYNFKRLEKILKKVNFNQIKNKKPQDSHKYKEPCLRIECIK